MHTIRVIIALVVSGVFILILCEQGLDSLSALRVWYTGREENKEYNEVNR